MSVRRTIIGAVLLVFVLDAALSKKRDVSWFDHPKTAKIQSPNLEQVHIQQPPAYQDTNTLQEATKKLKTITDVIDDTLTSGKQLDTIAAEAKKAGLKFHAMGCYLDNKKHEALPEQLADLQRSIDWANLNKTILVCAMRAKNAGYQVFGLQKFGVCYSGKDGLNTYDKFGKSKDCKLGVGRFGTNFVYSFESPVIPMKRPTVYCFPQEAKVETDKSRQTDISRVQIGDRIKTVDRLGNPIYSEVIAFLHRQEKPEAEYLSISTSNGRTLRVSSKHLVFRIDNTSTKTEAVFASELQVGDLLQTIGKSSESSRVVKITIATHVGVYAPLTRHGTMLVDGVLVSCYAHWESHTIAHVAMAPLRLWTDVTSFVTSLGKLIGFQGNQITRNSEGINWYALSLMNIVEKFVHLH